MNEALCRDRFTKARVARLATVGPDGPHLVPVVFAVDNDHLFVAVDHKPKRTTRLKRLTNIATNPLVSVLVDHYSDDWEQLWWVRADGEASIVTAPRDTTAGLDLLVAKYPQYRRQRPAGPLIDINVRSWSGWAAS